MGKNMIPTKIAIAEKRPKKLSKKIDLKKQRYKITLR